MSSVDRRWRFRGKHAPPPGSLKLTLVLGVLVLLAITASAPSLARQCDDFERLFFLEFDVIQSGGGEADEAMRELFSSDDLGCGYFEATPGEQAYIECGSDDSGDFGFLLMASR